MVHIKIKRFISICSGAYRDKTVYFNMKVAELPYITRVSFYSPIMYVAGLLTTTTTMTTESLPAEFLSVMYRSVSDMSLFKHREYIYLFIGVFF